MKPQKGAKSTEEVDTSDRVGTSSKVKKDRADRKKEAKTQMWSDVVKGLEIEGKLETTNSDKSGNGSETTDLAEQFDSDKPNHSKAKRSVRQPMPTSK